VQKCREHSSQTLLRLATLVAGNEECHAQVCKCTSHREVLVLQSLGVGVNPAPFSELFCPFGTAQRLSQVNVLIVFENGSNSFRVEVVDGQKKRADLVLVDFWLDLALLERLVTKNIEREADLVVPAALVISRNLLK